MLRMQRDSYVKYKLNIWKKQQTGECYDGRKNSRKRSEKVRFKGNKKQLEINRKKKVENFLSDLEQNKQTYEKKLKTIYQNVENRPLMMEIQGKKQSINEMKQAEDEK